MSNGGMMAITTFDAERLDACARNLAELLGRERPLAGVSESVEVIARAARDLITSRHVQAAVAAAAAGCDVEAILRAAGVLGADGKPTPRWQPPKPRRPKPQAESAREQLDRIRRETVQPSGSAVESLKRRMVPTCEADRREQAAEDEREHRQAVELTRARLGCAP